MKIQLVLIFSFIANVCYGIMPENLLQNDAFFEVTIAPEIHQDEWGVELACKRKLRIVRESKQVFLVQNVLRRRILLQDKSAVAYFSDYRLDNTEDFEMSIIKPNGKIIKVDLDDAIDVTEGVSMRSENQLLALERVDYKKLAIRFLEVGDIVDFTYSFETKISVAGTFGLLSGRDVNFLETLYQSDHEFGSNFFVLKEAFEIEIDSTLYINAQGRNGLGSIEKSQTDSTIIYSVILENIERVDDYYFINEDKIRKILLFDIYYCIDGRYSRTPMVLGNPGEIKSQASIEELKRTIYLNFQPKDIRRKERPKYLKIRTNSAKDYVKRAYRQMQWEYNSLEPGNYTIESAEYARYMYFGLKYAGFNPEIVVCIPKALENIENAIFSYDFYYGVRVKDKNDEDYTYSFPFSKFSSPEDWNYNVVGTNSYAFVPVFNYNKFDLVEAKIPDYEPSYNRTEVLLDVNFSIPNLKTQIISNTKHFGELKTDYASQILSGIDAIENWKFESSFLKRKKDLEQFTKRYVEINNNQRQLILENMKKADFELLNYKELKVIRTGMEMDNTVLEYSEEYTLGDLVHKVGNNMTTFDLGRLITEQIAIKERDLERSSDVYVDFVKKFVYTINLKIPAGYEVKNLEDIFTKIDNEAGFFSVSYSWKNNVLQITTEKRYKTNFLDKDDWSKMVEFLDTAYEFSQKKLILVEK